jgi:hypothetical protein
LSILNPFHFYALNNDDLHHLFFRRTTFHAPAEECKVSTFSIEK